jgi:hypothetical protein
MDDKRKTLETALAMLQPGGRNTGKSLPQRLKVRELKLRAAKKIKRRK